MTRKISPVKSAAGRLGGLARIKKHGNPGTMAGRRLGGLKSQITHTSRNTGFIVRKKVKLPSRSKKFAEFLGMMYGDGNNGHYQCCLTTSAISDREHIEHFACMAKEIFNIHTTVKHRKIHNTFVATISSAHVCDILEKNGLPKGSKVRNIIRIPDWITTSKIYSAACLRGLFDTDGCVYTDTHTTKDKVYRNLCISFSNHNKQLLDFFYNKLIEMGLHPTINGSRCIFLRRSKEIDIFFDVVGSSNPKHIRKYKEFRTNKGSVA